MRDAGAAGRASRRTLGLTGGHIYHGVADWRAVMGIDWMTRDELAQAIPPAYSEWIGRRLMAAITERTP